jgi:hypothetical protein
LSRRRANSAWNPCFEQDEHSNIQIATINPGERKITNISKITQQVFVSQALDWMLLRAMPMT